MRALLAACAAALIPLSTASYGPPAHALPGRAYESVAVDVTNDERTDHGLRRLRHDACLSRMAERHARRMAARQHVFHQDLDKVARLCGLSRTGENVAYGFASGRTVVTRGWMRSPAHRAAILTGPYRFVGVGAARSDGGHWYAAQLLGRR